MLDCQPSAINLVRVHDLGQGGRIAAGLSKLPQMTFSYYRTMMGQLILWILYLTAGLFLLVDGTNASRVHVDPRDNAYRGLVVAISPKIRQHSGKTIIPNLEAVLRNASSELFHARGVFLAEVTVVIPRSWSSKGAWARQPLPRVEAPSWQQWGRADILIERGEDSVFGENPFAVQYGGCGVKGRHLVIPDTFLRGYAAAGNEYILDRYDKYGKPHHVFLREWAAYRYGVFKEHGFPRDPVYPLYLLRRGSRDPKDVELNVCADRPLTPQFRNGNGMSCNATINLTNGLPLDPDCIPVFSAQRDAVEASIMAGLPAATHFCGGPRPHDRTLPTKQNSMCGGRSTNDVVDQHIDFVGRTHNGHLGRTRFVFVQERAQVVAFVVQITESTMQHNRRNYILRALNQFLRSEAPGDMQIALITYGAVASEIALRRAAASDEGVRNAVDALLLLNAEVESGNHVNSTLEDGLRAALTALNDTSEITERVAHSAFTKRVLVIGDGHCAENFSDLLRHSYDAQGVRVDAIIFPSRSLGSTGTSASADTGNRDHSTADTPPASQTTTMATTTAGTTLPPARTTPSAAVPSRNLDNTLDEFVTRTGGRILPVNDTPIDDSVTVSALQELYDALYAFTYADTSAAHYDSFNQIEQKEFHGKEQNEMLFQFDVDPTLNAELRVRLIGHDYGSDRPWTVSPKDIALYAPAGSTPNGKKTYSPKDYKFVSTNAQFWYYEFKIPEPAVGRWRLEAKTRRDTKQPIIVSAAAKPTTNENDEPITVDVWISQQSYNVSLQDQGLVVYAKVSKGSRPIVDANVIARITPVSDETETEIGTELKDNGAGDPDITKDDGIYSRYVEGIKKLGRHRLVVEARSEGSAGVLRSTVVPDDAIPHTTCCGSMVMRTSQNATRRFARRVQFGSFFVTSVAVHDQQNGDAYAAPARVADLHVAYLQSNPGGAGGVSLRWTATGNVRDHGRAASYVLKRFDNRDDVVAHFDESGQEISDWEMDDGPVLPKEAGSPEQIFFKLPNDVLLPQYFALRVNNTHGVISAISNVATVALMPPATASTSSIWSLGGSQGHGGSGASGDISTGGFPFASDQGLFGQRDGTRLLPSQLALIVTVPLIVLVLGVCILMVIVARRRRDPLLDKVKKATKDDKRNGANIDTHNSGAMPKNSQGNNMSPVLTPSSVAKEEISPMTSVAPSLPLSPSAGLNSAAMDINHSLSVSEANGVPVIMSHVTSQQQAGLSPVNHWPAEVLLEHYNKVQEAKQRNEQPPMLTLQPGHPDESIHPTSHGLYNTMDPFRGRPLPVGNSTLSNQMNGSLPHLPVMVNHGVYPPYYDNSPTIVTPTGVHVNAPSRNITHV